MTRRESEKCSRSGKKALQLSRDFSDTSDGKGVVTMKKYRCKRCRAEECIPTHQFVKFDVQVNYLCKQCWESFRKWFFHGQKVSHTGTGYGHAA